MIASQQGGGVLGAANDTASLSVAGYGTIGFEIAGAFTGTITFEGMVGGTWKALSVTPTNSTTAVTTATVVGTWIASCAGLNQVRARMSAYTNGAASITLLAVAASGGSGGGSGGGGGGGAVTVADGADVAQGTTTDAGIVTNTDGTVIGFLRGLVIQFAKLVAQILDYDTGAGTANQVGFGLFFPGAGGPVGAPGDATNGMFVNVKSIVATALAAGTALIGSFKLAGYQNATWAVNHNPGANTKATITQASAGGSTKNVCTGFTVTLAATSSAPAAVQVTVALIDGAAGGTTYLWGPTAISLPAVAGAVSAYAFGQRWDPGTAATAMTLEFSAAGGANTIETVTMSGTTTL